MYGTILGKLSYREASNINIVHDSFQILRLVQIYDFLYNVLRLNVGIPVNLKTNLTLLYNSCSLRKRPQTSFINNDRSSGDNYLKPTSSCSFPCLCTVICGLPTLHTHIDCTRTLNESAHSTKYLLLRFQLKRIRHISPHHAISMSIFPWFIA